MTTAEPSGAHAEGAAAPPDPLDDFVRHWHETVRLILDEERRLVEQVVPEGPLVLARAALGGDRLFFTGTGRSGLVMRMGAMRLAQMGFSAHVVGETVTPALRAGDWLVAFSGSGRTRTVRVAAEEARAAGGRILAITADAGSPLADLAESVIVLPAPVKDDPYVVAGNWCHVEAGRHAPP